MKVIFFDLYQTLIDVRIGDSYPNHQIDGWNAFAAALKKHGMQISGLEFQGLYMKKREDFYLEKNQKLHCHNLFELVREALKDDLGLNLSNQEITDLIYEYRKASRGWLRLYPGVLETTKALSKKYTLAVASHTQSSFTKIELDELNIANFFSHYIYTSDIGVRKESPEFYLKCLEIISKSAADCVMIGDNYEADVLMPRRLGMKAIWLKNPITCEKFLSAVEREEYYIDLDRFTSLPELIKIIFASRNEI